MLLLCAKTTVAVYCSYWGPQNGLYCLLLAVLWAWSSLPLDLCFGEIADENCSKISDCFGVSSMVVELSPAEMSASSPIQWNKIALWLWRLTYKIRMSFSKNHGKINLVVSGFMEDGMAWILSSFHHSGKSVHLFLDERLRERKWFLKLLKTRCVDHLSQDLNNWQCLNEQLDLDALTF